MMLNEISADEFVEYATFLFGAEWRNELPAKLGISRKSLVLSLASGEQISGNMTLSMLRLLENRLEEMKHEQALLADRINDLRGNPSTNFVPTVVQRGQLQHAC